jgi:hypothetical protein
MISQHTASEHDREIAQALDLMIAEVRTTAGNAAEQPHDSGDDARPVPVA